MIELISTVILATPIAYVVFKKKNTTDNKIPFDIKEIQFQNKFKKKVEYESKLCKKTDAIRYKYQNK